MLRLSLPCLARIFQLDQRETPKSLLLLRWMVAILVATTDIGDLKVHLASFDIGFDESSPQPSSSQPHKSLFSPSAEFRGMIEEDENQAFCFQPLALRSDPPLTDSSPTSRY